MIGRVICQCVSVLVITSEARTLHGVRVVLEWFKKLSSR